MEKTVGLEELIRDVAKRGELVHFSLWYEPTKKRWCATYSPSHQFGVSTAYHDDPVTAAVKALEGVAHARRRKRSEMSDAREPESSGGENGESQEQAAGAESVRDAGEGVQSVAGIND